MPTVLLVSFNLLPEGEYGGAGLVEALADRGIDARWVNWDDAEVDWSAADLVAVRSTWDYHRRLGEFLGWARAVDASARLLNGADVFAWNADKAYLRELATPVVPTELLDDTTLVTGLREALDRWGTVVIKPRTGAGGVGVVVAESVTDPDLEGLTAGPWIVQPLVGTVRTKGESSVFVLDGEVVAQVDKRASGGEVRVHERYGGSSHPVAIDPARAEVAAAAVREAAGLLDADLAYARVDLMEWDGRWVVSELELIEPGLYLDVAPEITGLFADMVARRLR